MDDIILNPTHARFECCIKLAKRSLEGLLHLTADYVVFEKKKKKLFSPAEQVGVRNMGVGHSELHFRFWGRKHWISVS